MTENTSENIFVDNKTELDGKVAVVTGGAGGIDLSRPWLWTENFRQHGTDFSDMI